METKNKQSLLEKIRRRLHFSYLCYVDPMGISGGLALWWNDEVDLQVRAKSQNLFRCVLTITGAAAAAAWLVTFVYAPPSWNDRKIFWNTLQNLVETNGYPWLCLGDFNEIGWSWEKQGSRGGNRVQMQFFQNFVENCELTDLKFKGAPYTWTNNQGGDPNIRERLDKTMATVE